MSAIRLRGATSGTTDVVAAAIAGDGVLTLPTGTGTLATQAFVNTAVAAGGKVLQVVSVTKTDTFSTTSTSYVDITGVSISITPSATTSKIMVMAETAGGGGTSDMTMHFRVTRNGTGVNVGDADGSRVRNTFSIYTTTASGIPGGGWRPNINGNSTFLDSPATVSAVTYKLQMLVDSGTGYVGRPGDNPDDSRVGRSPTNLTLWEISA